MRACLCVRVRGRACARTLVSTHTDSQRDSRRECPRALPVPHSRGTHGYSRGTHGVHTAVAAGRPSGVPTRAPPGPTPRVATRCVAFRFTVHVCSQVLGMNDGVLGLRSRLSLGGTMNDRPCAYQHARTHAHARARTQTRAQTLADARTHTRINERTLRRWNARGGAAGLPAGHKVCPTW